MVAIFSIACLLISCSSKPSLQKYFVEKMDDSTFLVVNIPLNLEAFFSDSLTVQETTSLRTIKKLNLLMYKVTKGAEADYEKEKAQLTDILMQDQFEELISFQTFGSNGRVLFEGDSENIDEAIIWLQSPEYGFGLIRVLGRQMNPATLFALINKIDQKEVVNQGPKQFGPLMDIFKGLKAESEKKD